MPALGQGLMSLCCDDLLNHPGFRKLAIKGHLICLQPKWPNWNNPVNEPRSALVPDGALFIQCPISRVFGMWVSPSRRLYQRKWFGTAENGFAAGRRINELWKG